MWFGRGMRLSLLVAGAAVLTLAGCGPTHSSIHGAAATPHSSAGTTVSTRRPTPSSPAPTSSPSISVASSTSASVASPAPTAGTDVSACATWNCVVQVKPGTRITFQPGLDIDSLRVVSIDRDKVTIEVQSNLKEPGFGDFRIDTACSGQGQDGVITDQLGVGCRMSNMGLRLAVDSIDNGDGYSAELVIDRAPCSYCYMVGNGSA